MMARCNECGWSVPWDEVGAALMRAHLMSEHDWDGRP